MLDRSILGASWESVVSRDDYDIDLHSLSSPRGSPLKDTSNLQEEPSYCISRHNPNKTYRREAVIASWKSLKKEREQALGKRTVIVDAENYQDYYGRNKVKRCTSDRTANAPRVLKKVKRTYSVLHRYDPNEEKVVKEYKYQPLRLPQPEEVQHEEVKEMTTTKASMKKYHSEPFLNTPQAPEKASKKKVKRSFTTLLSIKTKFLNIFAPKS